MSLAMLGHNASYEFRWRRWALLRDAVITHLEAAGGRYTHFTSIGDALGVESVRIDAAALARELEDMRVALAKRSIEELVLAPKTARVLYPDIQLDAARPLTRTELAQVAPIGDARTLADYFSSMLESMLHVCAHPTADGTIEIHDG